VKLRAELLLAHNVRALLKARGQKPHDLAFYFHRSDAWISKILNAEFAIDPKDKRGLRVVDLDRLADFFGLATYQLFAPGISPLTERRGGRERRTGRDRRISQAEYSPRPAHTPDLETVTPWERAHLARVRRLDPEDRKHMEYLIDRALLWKGDGPKIEVPADPADATVSPDETAPNIPTPRKRR
jgi:hypothetical protein